MVFQTGGFMRPIQPVRTVKWLFIGAMLLPLSGLFAAGGCIYREKEKVRDRPEKVIVEEHDHPRVIKHDTVIERD